MREDLWIERLKLGLVHRKLNRWELVAYVFSLVMGTFVIACTAEPDWTAEEKENALHYLRSSQADLAAVKANNQLGESGPREMPEDAYRYVLTQKKMALEEAKLVRDNVLEKACPGMSVPFRQKYQRSLELQIRNLETGDVQAEIMGSALHDEWVDWINARRVKIPK